MSVVDKLEAALLSSIGANDPVSEVKHWIDMGYPPLNEIISNDYERGFPQGRLMEIYGPSASGKTVLATQAMVAAQKAGGVAMFVDWERAFNEKFAAEFGLNTTFPHFIFKQSETWEQGHIDALKAGELIRKSKAIADDAPIVIVFDSIAAALPKSVIEKDIDEQKMNDSLALAKVISSTIKIVNHAVSKFNLTVIYLNQERDNVGVIYGPKTRTPGGKAMEYYASVRIAVSAEKVMKGVGKKAEFNGRNITFKVVKNKVGKPFGETKVLLTYDENGKAVFDYRKGMVEYLLSKGVLTAASNGRVEYEDKTYWVSDLGQRLTLEELVAMLPKK